MKKEENYKEESFQDEESEKNEGLEEINKKEVETQNEGENNIEEEEKSKAARSILNEEELQNRLIRLQADFDNHRKRTLKEKDDIFKYAIEEFSKKLLPVIDNLERAVKSIDEAKVDDSYAEGVKMVLTQLMEVLIKEGLQEIVTEDVEFDPKFHHGVTAENVDTVENNHIIEVYQKGYTFKDKVIRPAMVKICKK
ncbi:MAG: nucleotide exchange factor GrpE [Eubacteriales bacterium]